MAQVDRDSIVQSISVPSLTRTFCVNPHDKHSVALGDLSIIQLDNDFSMKLRSNISSRKSRDFNHTFLDLQWHPKEVSTLVTATLKGSVILWDTNKIQKNNNGIEIGCHSSCCYSVSWDPFHNTQLVTSSEDGQVILWDRRLSSGEYAYDWHVGSPIHKACFNPSIEYLFTTGDEEGVVRMYDTRVEGRPLYSRQFHHDHIYSLSYNPLVNNVLASGCRQGYVYIYKWNGTSLEPIYKENPEENSYPSCFDLKSQNPDIYINMGVSVYQIDWNPYNANMLAACTHIPVNSIDFYDIRRRHLCESHISFKGTVEQFHYLYSINIRDPNKYMAILSSSPSSSKERYYYLKICNISSIPSVKSYIPMTTSSISSQTIITSFNKELRQDPFVPPHHATMTPYSHHNGLFQVQKINDSEFPDISYSCVQSFANYYLYKPNDKYPTLSDVCKYNSKVAKQLQKPSIAQLWLLLSFLLLSSSKNISDLMNLNQNNKENRSYLIKSHSIESSLENSPKDLYLGNTIIIDDTKERKGQLNTLNEGYKNNELIYLRGENLIKDYDLNNSNLSYISGSEKDDISNNNEFELIRKSRSNRHDNEKNINNEINTDFSMIQQNRNENTNTTISNNHTIHQTDSILDQTRLLPHVYSSDSIVSPSHAYTHFKQGVNKSSSKLSIQSSSTQGISSFRLRSNSSDSLSVGRNLSSSNIMNTKQTSDQVHSTSYSFDFITNDTIYRCVMKLLDQGDIQHAAIISCVLYKHMPSTKHTVYMNIFSTYVDMLYRLQLYVEAALFLKHCPLSFRLYPHRPNLQVRPSSKDDESLFAYSSQTSTKHLPKRYLPNYFSSTNSISRTNSSSINSVDSIPLKSISTTESNINHSLDQEQLSQSNTVNPNIELHNTQTTQKFENMNYNTIPYNYTDPNISICPLCELPVTGLITMCMVCGHGGHKDHIQQYCDDLKRKHFPYTCPVPGCPCTCCKI